MRRIAPLALPIALLLAAPALAQISGPTLEPGPIAPAAAPAANPYLHDETRADAEGKAAQMFAAMDLDHDGFVTADEAAAFIAAHSPKAKAGTLKPATAMAKDMITDADTDKDGKVSAEESKAAADRGFDEADTDHNGVVTPEERAAAMKDDTPAPKPATPKPAAKAAPAKAKPKPKAASH